MSALSALRFCTCAQIDAYAGQPAYRGAIALEGSAKDSLSANVTRPDSSRSKEGVPGESSDQRYEDERDFELFLQD
jgi:hypothetical protein